MGAISLPASYIRWHYSDAPGQMLRIWRNFLIFVVHFFSLPMLLKTLFSPWRRLGEERKPGFDPTDFASVLVINTFMRFVGFLLRSMVIVIALFCLLMVTAFGIIFFILWFLSPLLSIIFFFKGVALLF
jgi:hypothetical protein